VRAVRYVGCSISWDTVDADCGTDSRSELAKYTTMRHDLVHRGKRRVVVRRDAQNCVNLASAVAKAVNEQAVQLYLR
jgi:hypothetical protein